jgi:hypothetical protein
MIADPMASRRLGRIFEQLAGEPPPAPPMCELVAAYYRNLVPVSIEELRRRCVTPEQYCALMRDRQLSVSTDQEAVDGQECGTLVAI